MDSIRFSEPLSSTLHDPCTEPELYWLGQAGFLFRSSNLGWAIDPYLSNRLAEKYRNHELSHQRLMPPPLDFPELPYLDFVFCTHHHGDHLDGPTLEWIAAHRPDVQFVVPAGIEVEIRRLSLPLERVLWAEADRPITLRTDFHVVPVPAAHEKFGYDDAGHHRFLGYVFHCGGSKIYHSGDTIPYDGLPERLMEQAPDLALLPVNGRRRELSERNIPGNFTLAEAIELCRDAHIPFLIAHHYGMFAFNTIDPALIDEAAKAQAPGLIISKAEIGMRYRLRTA